MQIRYQYRLRIFLETLLVLTLTFASFVPLHTSAQPKQTPTPFPERDTASSWLIVDTAQLFDQAMMDRFQFDLRRAEREGMPIIVYTRHSDESQAQSQIFADTMRDQWNVETSDGADDGLVILITINQIIPSSSSILFSWGANTLPTHQLTEEIMNQVYVEKMLPLFQTGDYFSALSWGMRKIVYYLEYSAPEVPSLSDSQQRIHDLMAWWSLALPVVAIAILPGLIAGRKKKLTVPIPSQTAWVWASLSASLAAATLLASVYSRSNVGTLSGFLCLLAIGITLIGLRRLRRGDQSHSSTRVRVRSTNDPRRSTQNASLQPVQSDG